MIDRAATIEKFGYDPDELSRGTRKRVVAVCEGCGKVRDLRKRQHNNLCKSCSTKKRYEDPEVRENHSIKMKKHYEDPASRETTRTASKTYWRTPEARRKQSVTIKKYYEDNPDAREKNSAAKKKYYKDTPDAREKNSARRKKYWKEHPEARAEIGAERKRYFEDPEARQRLSATKQGIPYDDWEAFAKDQPYCPAFNETCRESNRKKYGRRCFICDLPESENITKDGKQMKLSVHHIDLNKNQGCDGHEWRLIPTCIHHHNNVIHTPLWIARIMYLLRVGA
jgi:hypothetical protein